MHQEHHRASASPIKASPAAASDPAVLLAAPVNGADPVPWGATGVIGVPVAEGPEDPAPEPATEPDEPVPVGNGAPVPVANPVEPATPEEL